MHFILKNNEHTNDIIESLKTFGEEVTIDAFDVLTFVSVDTSSKSTISAYATHNIQKEWIIRVYSKKDVLNCFEMNMENVETIYSL